MTSCIKLPVACSEWNGHPLRLRGIENSPAALSNATQIQLDAVTRERDALRCMVVAQTGQKRKEPSDVSKKKTLDPRKRLRLSSPEDKLHAKISELEGFLSKVLEESKARRNSDQLALFNMRTCLKDLMDQANVNQELIRKLESDVSLKEKAIQTTSTALDARNKEIAIAENTIGNIGERLKYLEHDRKYLKADVRRYRANAEQIQAHYQSRLRRQELEDEWHCARQRQSRSSASTGGYVELQDVRPQLSTNGGECDGQCSNDAVNERAAHQPESRSRSKALEGKQTL